MTVPERVFCILYAASDQTPETGCAIYREVFKIPQGKGKRIAHAVQKLLERREIQYELDQRGREAEEHRDLRARLLHESALDVAIARQRLVEENLKAALAVVQTIARSTAGGQKPNAAQMKGLELSLKTTGQIGGDTLRLDTPVVSQQDAQQLADRFSTLLSQVRDGDDN